MMYNICFYNINNINLCDEINGYIKVVYVCYLYKNIYIYI